MIPGHRCLPSLVAVLLPLAAAAQERPRAPRAVRPERPTVATHAYAVAPGWMEVEAGVEFDRQGDGTREATAPVVVKVGLAPRLQLSLLGAVERSASGGSSGIGDLAVGLKWQVFRGVPLVGDVAVLPSVKLPSASTASGLGTGTTDAGLLLVASRQLGPVALDLNVGYTRRSGNGTRAARSASVWTVSTGGRAVGAVGWVAEVFGYPGTSGPAGEAPRVALLAGPTLLLRPSLGLDAGVILPLRGPQPRAVYVGVVTNLGQLW